MDIEKLSAAEIRNIDQRVELMMAAPTIAGRSAR